jgi:hypothetical protein
MHRVRTKELAGKLRAPGELLTFIQKKRFDVTAPVHRRVNLSSLDPRQSTVNPCRHRIQQFARERCR